MNKNMLITILILFLYSCSSEREIKTNVSNFDDIGLYNAGTKHLKKKNMKKQLKVILNLKFNTPTHLGPPEDN